jgi:ABC-type transport system involved in Fe-S cluster assembly fused permease/ATPase subunit
LFYKPSGIKGWIWFFTKWFGMLFLSLLLFAVILGLLAPESKTTANPSSRTQSPKPMNESTFIDNAVARDVIKQYELVKKHGSDIEVCVHAQIVQAAYLQGKNEEKFVEWQKIARADCKKAGMPE